MNQRNAYLIQILEKIGSPLLSAVMGKDTDGMDAKEGAAKIATLLSRTVQLSIDLGRMVEIEKSSPEEIESLRVAMAGLAGPIIASQYIQGSKIPSENDVKRLTGALEAVMTFSDNFTPSDEHVIRLENMKANGMPGDAYQINIQYLQAFVPIADVVATFPFGQPEKKLMQDVADKINTKATLICNDVFGSKIEGNQRKLCELALVKSLADLYARCHKVEMDKLTNMQEPDASAQHTALQSVWENFDTRAEILGMMAQNMVPNAATSGTEPTPPPQQTPQTAATSSETASTGNPMATFSQPKDESNGGDAQPSHDLPHSQEPQQDPQKSSPPEQQTDAPPAGNPMAMFSKPKNSDTAGNAPKTPLPPQDTQPTEPPPAPSSPQQENKQQADGGPMSFFKSPPKEKDEE